LVKAASFHREDCARATGYIGLATGLGKSLTLRDLKIHRLFSKISFFCFHEISGCGVGVYIYVLIFRNVLLAKYSLLHIGLPSHEVMRRAFNGSYSRCIHCQLLKNAINLYPMFFFTLVSRGLQNYDSDHRKNFLKKLILGQFLLSLYHSTYAFRTTAPAEFRPQRLLIKFCRQHLLYSASREIR
jgi:hypothetical protein